MSPTRKSLLAGAALAALVLSAGQAGAHDGHHHGPSPSVAEAAGLDAPLFENLGSHSYAVSTAVPLAQAYFDQGLRWAWGFNHVEAVRAFRAAQGADPSCAMCFWGEAWALGPNINMPMVGEAVAPALSALGRAKALAAGATPRERALIQALSARYSADPGAERAGLDRAYAAEMAPAGDAPRATLEGQAAARDVLPPPRTSFGPLLERICA